ncbi:MAG: packaged DNA stabilization protein [Geminicoccaceae bacterium]
MQPVPFSIQAYKAPDRSIEAQCFINYFAQETPPDEKTPVLLLPRPGLPLFANVGTGPIRGEHTVKGQAFVVSGTNLYSVDANGNSQDLGAIVGDGVVRMDDNGTELAIASGEKGYIFDGLTLELISDPDFPGAIDVAYLDGYFVWLKPRSAEFFISALRDGKSYDPLDFATAEADPDDNLSLIVDNRFLWIFANNTIELWFNSGASDFPLERVAGGVIQRGLVAAESPARLDNSVFWLGTGEDGGFVVYRNSGVTPLRVSTHPIERAIESYDNVTEAIGLSFTLGGHSFYSLTFPGIATWVYDANTQLWSQWDSRSDKNASIKQWRAIRHTFAYNKHLVGDFENGNIYTLDLDMGTDNNETIVRRMTTPVIHNDREDLTMDRFELDIRRGVGLTEGQGSDPQAILRFSDDNGNTWSNDKTRSFGKRGDYEERVTWNRLGQFKERIVEISISDPVPTVIKTGYMNGEPRFG